MSLLARSHPCGPLAGLEMPSNPRCPAAQQKLTRSVFSLPLSYLANLICLSVSKAQLCLGSLLEFPIVPVGERGNVAGMGWGGDGDGDGMTAGHCGSTRSVHQAARVLWPMEVCSYFQESRE